MYPAVSVKHSKQEAGKSSGQNPLRRTTLHSRDGRNRQRNMHHGSSPRLYATLSRSKSKTSPPKRKSFGCAFAHTNRAICHLSNGGTPSSLIQSSPRNVSSSIGGPSTSGRRCTAISAGHTLRTPTRLTQTAFLPQHIQRGTQHRNRMGLNPLHASLAPQLQGLPPLPSRPLIRIERHQLWWRRHSQRRTTMSGHQEASPLSSATLLFCAGRQRALAATRACLWPGRIPDSSPSSGKANESTSRRNNKR
jgi:hypothetical protein